MANAYQPLIDETELTLEECAVEVIGSARRVGGVAGVIVDEDALLTLAARLVWDRGVEIGRELEEDVLPQGTYGAALGVAAALRVEGFICTVREDAKRGWVVEVHGKDTE